MNTKIARALVLAGAFFLAALGARAQNQTHITATVTDAQGVPYANATVSMTLVPSGVNPTVNGQQIGGQANTRLDANGVLDYSLFSNAAIVPANTKWFFQITESPGVLPPLGTGTQSFSTTLTISGASQSLTATFNALAPKLTTITVGGGAPAGCSILSGILTCTGFLASITNFATTPNAVKVVNAAAPAGDFTTLAETDAGAGGMVVQTTSAMCGNGLSSIAFSDDGAMQQGPCDGGGWDTDTSGNTCVPNVGSTCFDQNGNLTLSKGGKITFQGATSGAAAVGVPAVAGTPAQINMPIATGAAGQVLSTDAATPQQTSWVTRSSAMGVNISSVFTSGGSVTTDQNTQALTIPANALNVSHRTMEIWYAGSYSTNAANLSTVNLKVKICSVSGCGSGNVLTLVSITSAANVGGVSNLQMNFSGEAATNAVGATLVMESHGNYSINIGATNALPLTVYADTNNATVRGAPADIDTTAQNFLQVTCAFSIASASNICQGRELIVVLHN